VNNFKRYAATEIIPVNFSEIKRFGSCNKGVVKSNCTDKAYARFWRRRENDYKESELFPLLSSLTNKVWCIFFLGCNKLS